MNKKESGPHLERTAKFADIKLEFKRDIHPADAFNAVRNAIVGRATPEQLAAFDIEGDWLVTGVLAPGGVDVPQRLDAALPSGETPLNFLRAWVTIRFGWVSAGPAE